MTRERTTARRGLGRGLGSLIPTAPVDPVDTEAPADDEVTALGFGPELVVPEGSWFAEVPADQIVPNRVQPRQVFDEDAMAELVHSIREVGLLQPIVVRPVKGEGPESYELVMGERRWRAAQLAGLERIPAIVRAAGTPTCCATRCWRTCTAPSSTRWKRRPRTSSCSTTSAAPTTSWPSGSAGPGRRSPTPSGC